MSTTPITIALERITAAANTTLAANYGDGTTWNDAFWGFFYDWKWLAAGFSVVLLCSAGIWKLGQARITGALLIVGGLFLGGFFASIEHWIHITQNTEKHWEHPSNPGNPFNRT